MNSVLLFFCLPFYYSFIFTSNLSFHFTMQIVICTFFLKIVLLSFTDKKIYNLSVSLCLCIPVDINSHVIDVRQSKLSKEGLIGFEVCINIWTDIRSMP